MNKMFVLSAAVLLTALLSCETPLDEEWTPPPEASYDPPADFIVPNAETTAANTAELARYVSDGYTYIGYDGDVDAVFAAPDGNYYLIFNNGSITTETVIEAPRVTIYAKGDFFIPKDKSVICANLCVEGNIKIEGSLSCTSFILCKGSIDYSGALLEGYMICVNGTFNAGVDTETPAAVIIGSDFNVTNNIITGGIWILGNAAIEGGKALSSGSGEIIIEKDLTIHNNGVEGGYVVSGNEELSVNGDVYIDGDSVEKIKNATLPQTITTGNKQIRQLNNIYEMLNRSVGFSKLNFNLGENDVLSEKVIAPEGSDIVIRDELNRRRGLTIGKSGEFVIAGEKTRVVFDVNISVSGKLSVGQGGAAELGKNRELEIIDKGALVIIDSLLKPENKTTVTGVAARSGGAAGLVTFDAGGVNLFYNDEDKYAEMGIKNGGGISVVGNGGVNIYGGGAAAENNTRLYGDGAVFGGVVLDERILLKATAEGGLIKIPASAAGSGAALIVGGSGVIDFGAGHTAKDGIELVGIEGENSFSKGTLRLLNGAYIGSASIPVITAGGGSITQLGTLAAVANTDFSEAGTFAQAVYNNGEGVNIQNITAGYGTISTGIDTENN